MSSYASFQRQLNRYCFKIITRFNSPDRDSYYHELFLRGRPSLSQLIRGKRYKDNYFKPLSNPQNEPDFYHISYCYSLIKEFEEISSDGSDSPQHDTTSTYIAIQNAGHVPMKNNYFLKISTLNTLETKTRNHNIFISFFLNDYNSSILDGVATAAVPHTRFQYNHEANITNISALSQHHISAAYMVYITFLKDPLLVHLLIISMISSLNARYQLRHRRLL